MEDQVLKAQLNEHTTVYVTTIDCETYKEHVTEDNLGGGQGYFLIRAWKKGDISRFDVLAKAPSFDAAGDLFDMLVSRSG